MVACSSLGDSITFGYNLDPTNAHPSSQAFPALIADDIHYQLLNFEIPGDTSANPLAHLKTKAYRQALGRSTVITLYTMMRVKNKPAKYKPE